MKIQTKITDIKTVEGDFELEYNSISEVTIRSELVYLIDKPAVPYDGWYITPSEFREYVKNGSFIIISE
jgi:hypothetical protein